MHPETESQVYENFVYDKGGIVDLWGWSMKYMTSGWLVIWRGPSLPPATDKISFQMDYRLKCKDETFKLLEEYVEKCL